MADALDLGSSAYGVGVRVPSSAYFGPSAGVAKLADAQDLKSCGPNQTVPVRSRSPALQLNTDTYAQIAQLVEQRTENPRVTGSIPVLGTRTECLRV